MQADMSIFCSVLPPDVDHTVVQLKWTPDQCFQEEQGSDVWIIRRLENKIHTSPVVPYQTLSPKEKYTHAQKKKNPCKWENDLRTLKGFV